MPGQDVGASQRAGWLRESIVTYRLLAVQALVDLVHEPVHRAIAGHRTAGEQSVCGSCEPVRERRETYRRLMPEVDVRLLLTEPVTSRWAESDEPQSLHDEHDYVGESLGYRGTPSAVLLGADGLLAGGPVTGDRAVDRFVDEIYESLHGEQPVRDDALA